MTEPDKSTNPPAATCRVFISYSHDSAEHTSRVLALANRLRNDGIESWIDRYVQDPNEGWISYDEGGRNEKFRPVVFREEDKKYISVELRRFNRYRVDTPEGYEKLLRWLHEAPRAIVPIVGQRPDLPTEPVPELFPSKLDGPRDPTVRPSPEHEQGEEGSQSDRKSVV